MNTQRLQTLVELLRTKYAEQHDMQDWFTSYINIPITGERAKPANCGTAGCIAGITLAEWHEDEPIRLDETRRKWLRLECTIFNARRLLGLSSEKAEKLFYPNCWPTKFNDMYLNATTPRELSEVTAQRIEHFIKTEGRE